MPAEMVPWQAGGRRIEALADLEDQIDAWTDRCRRPELPAAILLLSTLVTSSAIGP